jgi:hypothetical protein
MPEFIVADGRRFYDGQQMHSSGERVYIDKEDYQTLLPRGGVLIPLDQEGADALKMSEADVKRMFPDGFPERREAEAPAPEEETDEEERARQARLPPAIRDARIANIRFNRENPDHKPWEVPENANAPAMVAAAAGPGEATVIGAGPRAEGALVNEQAPGQDMPNAPDTAPNPARAPGEVPSATTAPSPAPGAPTPASGAPAGPSAPAAPAGTRR